MKKLIALATLFAATTASAGFTGNASTQRGGFSGGPAPDVVTVQAALKAMDNMPVALTGKIVRQLDNDEFIFRDSTGDIKIEVENEAWNGQNITPNDQITIHGKVDVNGNGMRPSEVEVYRIEKK